MWHKLLNGPRIYRRTFFSPLLQITPLSKKQCIFRKRHKAREMTQNEIYFSSFLLISSFPAFSMNPLESENNEKSRRNFPIIFISRFSFFSCREFFLLFSLLPPPTAWARWFCISLRLFVQHCKKAEAEAEAHYSSTHIFSILLPFQLVALRFPYYLITIR